ncbi:hypothetical protein D3C78_1758080 [compost metagenome]
MADGKVVLPSSRARSARWSGRLQPTVELDVPKSTPHAVEIMENSGAESKTADKCTRFAEAGASCAVQGHPALHSDAFFQRHLI